MMTKSTLALVALAIASMPTHAAIVASTDFNGRTLPSSNTAGNLNWSLDGVDDPGDMSALNEGGSPQALFNTTTLVQNIFIPGINTGNGNTFWTTDVSVTVSSGFAVTLTDVTFNYYAVNGGQAQNVDRKSDFTITLIDPSSSVVEAVTIADVVNGTSQDPGGVGTAVSVPFSIPRALSDPGTYTIQIKGGDFIGDNETGNHTGIDDLSINGDVTVIPEPSALLLGGLGFLALLRRRRA